MFTIIQQRIDAVMIKKETLAQFLVKIVKRFYIFTYFPCFYHMPNFSGFIRSFSCYNKISLDLYIPQNLPVKSTDVSF